MSIYTDAEHAIVLSETEKWRRDPPSDACDWYAYGKYQWRLKNFRRGAEAFQKAGAMGEDLAWLGLALCMVKDGQDGADPYFQKAWGALADSEPLPEDQETFKTAAGNRFLDFWYQRAYMLAHEIIEKGRTEEAEKIFRKLIQTLYFYQPDDFLVKTNYTFEGSHPDRSTEACMSPVGACWYELAWLEIQKTQKDNRSEIRSLLRKAYDTHCEEGLFLDYRLYCAGYFGENQGYEGYEYQREIRELTAYRIGQYVRVAETDPYPAALCRLEKMYRAGFPGDTGIRDREFRAKAGMIERKRKNFMMEEQECG